MHRPEPCHYKLAQSTLFRYSDLMTQKLPPTQEYARLIHYLWERINVTPVSDTESLKALSYATYDLMETFEDDGLMRNLNRWVDLKRDAPDAFEDYGDNLKQDYLEFFTKPLV